MTPKLTRLYEYTAAYLPDIFTMAAVVGIYFCFLPLHMSRVSLEPEGVIVWPTRRSTLGIGLMR
jgi:hypothetical protein